MQINNPSSSRAAWYDRNAASQIGKYNSGDIAPHVETARWTYTVPTAKKFIMENGYVSVGVATVATTVALSYAGVSYTPSGGSGIPIVTAISYDNTTNSTKYASLGVSVMGFSGDSFEGYDADNSTGGTRNFTEDMKGSEFDA